MKGILKAIVISLILILVSGCTLVGGKYKEGTYFGYDKESNYTAVVYIDNNGYIKSVFIDAAYGKKDNDGNVTATSKQILGDDYGMRASSTIDSEWYEQVEKIADKVIKEQGIDWLKFKYRIVNDEGDYEFVDDKPEDSTNDDKNYTDSVSGVTIHVNESYNAIKAALEKAKK